MLLANEEETPMNLEGNAAIVTGGGTGVGRQTAIRLAEQGCSVLVNYSRSREGAEQAAAECEKLGVKALAVRADILAVFIEKRILDHRLDVNRLLSDVV